MLIDKEAEYIGEFIKFIKLIIDGDIARLLIRRSKKQEKRLALTVAVTVVVSVFRPTNMNDFHSSIFIIRKMV